MLSLPTNTFGGRNDSLALAQLQRNFYENVFFPTLEKHNIKTILDLGDTFDRRKYVNYASLHDCRDFYFDRIDREGYELHSIVGNHDIYYKSTNRVNSIGELFSHYKTIHNYAECCEVEFDGLKVLFIPWINKENYERTIEMIETTDAQVAMGHLELKGFEMYRGAINTHGFSHTIFRKFDQVFSGHYHHKSTLDNVSYLGAPYPMTWIDYNDPRGFHLYDTDTRELTFIENPYTMFHKVLYDDVNDINEQSLKEDYSHITDCYVKLIVREKEKPYLFDLFVDHLQTFNPIQLQTVEDHMNLDFEVDEDMIDEAQDTVTIMRSYIDALGIEEKETVTDIMTELYNEAVSRE